MNLEPGIELNPNRKAPVSGERPSASSLFPLLTSDIKPHVHSVLFKTA